METMVIMAYPWKETVSMQHFRWGDIHNYAALDLGEGGVYISDEELGLEGHSCQSKCTFD